MPTWPATLPQSFLIDGYSYQARPNTIRSDMETGRPKIRRRFTKPIIDVSGNVFLTKAQVEILQTFYETDCAGGAISFTWTDVITDVSKDYNFKEPPVYSPAGQFFIGRLTLEELP